MIHHPHDDDDEPMWTASGVEDAGRFGSLSSVDLAIEPGVPDSEQVRFRPAGSQRLGHHVVRGGLSGDERKNRRGVLVARERLVHPATSNIRPTGPQTNGIIKCLVRLCNFDESSEPRALRHITCWPVWRFDGGSNDKYLQRQHPGMRTRQRTAARSRLLRPRFQQ